MPPALWALLVPPIWLFSMTLVGGPLLGHIPLAAVHVLALAVATGVVVGLNARVLPPAVPRARWRPPRGWLVVPALIAGVGVSILTSEIDNIMRGRFPPPELPGVALEPGPVPAVVLAAVVHAVAITWVACGVVLHALLVAGMRPRTAIVLSTIGACLMTAQHLQLWPAVALVGAVSAWIYASGRSLLLALGVWAPVPLLALLHAAGVAPGIPGYDLTRPGEVELQPLWFDLLGALLAAAGVGTLIRAFEGTRPAEPTAPDPG